MSLILVETQSHRCVNVDGNVQNLGGKIDSVGIEQCKAEPTSCHPVTPKRLDWAVLKRKCMLLSFETIFSPETPL